MHLTFLGKNTNKSGSPTLYATDRDTLIVQGWKVQGRDDQVEIPHRLLAHTRPGTSVGAQLHDTGRGSFMLTGIPVTDADAIAQMDIPGFETSIEVPVGQEIWIDGPVEG